MNIFNFAKKMELNGKEFYEKLGAATDIPGLKTIFNTLAADEQKHYDTIAAMEVGSVVKMADSTSLDMAQNVFQVLKDKDTLVNGMKKDLDGYRLAMKIEADSVKFYEDAARKEQRIEVRELLQKIATEEKAHYNIMENLYDFVLRPEYFLAWREFSNIQDL